MWFLGTNSDGTPNYELFPGNGNPFVLKKTPASGGSYRMGPTRSPWSTAPSAPSAGASNSNPADGVVNLRDGSGSTAPSTSRPASMTSQVSGHVSLLARGRPPEAVTR